MLRRQTLEAIRKLAGTDVVDPWTDPETLSKAVSLGIMDAPQLKNNAFAKGVIKTRIIDGGCTAVDNHGKPMVETERLDGIIKQGRG